MNFKDECLIHEVIKYLHNKAEKENNTSYTEMALSVATMVHEYKLMKEKLKTR